MIKFKQIEAYVVGGISKSSNKVAFGTHITRIIPVTKERNCKNY